MLYLSKRVVPIAVFILSLYFMTGCSQVTPLSDTADRITIISTGDLQGRLDPAVRPVRLLESGEKIEVVGGISRIATLLKQIRQESGNPVIVISSGDDLMGSYFRQFDGKAIFGLMESAGYEVLGLGNHEFDTGPGVLAEALDTVGFTALCSDLQVENTVLSQSCHPYLLREYQGVQIGLFSLMTEDFPVVTLTGDVTIVDNQIKAAEKAIKTLKQQGAQVIIAVTHIGADLDRKLAATVNGIDIIVGGHSHDYLYELETINNTLIINGGEKGSALAQLDVSLDKDSKVIPDSAAYSLLPVISEIKPDPATEAKLSVFRQQLPATTVVGTTEKEWDLTKATLRSRESSVANMITDIIRKQFDVDVVLYNGGTFRGNATYQPGSVSDTMLAEIDEFENNVFLLTMQGKYIQEILEHSASLIGQGGFLQGSGFQVTIDSGAQPQQLTGKDNTDFAVSKPGNRIKEIRILANDGSWQPLDIERNYRLASNDFLVKLGGDRYFWFQRYGKEIRNTYSTMASIMADVFRRDKVVNPVGPDGRITIK